MEKKTSTNMYELFSVSNDKQKKESNIEQVDDTLQPHSEGLEKVLKGLDENFRESIFGENGGRTNDVIQKFQGKKRIRSKSEDSNSSKEKRKNKKKEESDDEDNKEERGNYYSDEIIKKMMENESLKKMNVPELKDICRIRNIKTKGHRKSEILEKIQNYLDEEAE